MKIELPREVHNIITILQEHGHEAYAVGGAVRDAYLGRTPKDWDVTTDAKPEEIKSYFNRTVDTGIKHGTVTVLMGKCSFEVTTYRIDGEYLDSRHPQEVIFTSSLVEDLKRRDFTINAMAYNEKEGLIDEFGGVKDLEDKIIRTVGSPLDRFDEDALRMLRALRFSAQLGFSVDNETRKAISSLAPTINNISAERIRDELLKLIESDNPGHILELYNLGLTKYFLPEFDDMMACEQKSRHHSYSVGIHTVKSMEYIRAERNLRLTMLLHDMGKPSTKSLGEDGYNHFYGHPAISAEIATKVLRRLKLDNNTIRDVVRLVRSHDERPKLGKKSVRRAIVRIGEDAFPEIFEVQRADTMAQSEYKREEKLNYIDDFENVYNEIIQEKSCLKMSELKITGSDLMAMGLREGPKIGRILHKLFDEVVDDPSKNEINHLRRRASQLIDNMG